MVYHGGRTGICDLTGAQYGLGLCHEREEEGPEAVACYRIAADQGDTRAMYRLALCMERGFGVQKNPRAALQWFRQAAQEQPEARYKMGLYAEKGWGGEPRSHIRAKILYRMAADQGSEEARKALERLNRRWI